MGRSGVSDKRDIIGPPSLYMHMGRWARDTTVAMHAILWDYIRYIQLILAPFRYLARAG